MLRESQVIPQFYPAVLNLLALTLTLVLPWSQDSCGIFSYHASKAETRQKVWASHLCPLCSRDILPRNCQKSTIISHRPEPCHTASSSCKRGWNSNHLSVPLVPWTNSSFKARRGREINMRETINKVTVGCLLKYIYLGNTGFIFLLTELLRVFNMPIHTEANTHPTFCQSKQNYFFSSWNTY